MAKKNDRISDRLAAITKAAAPITNVRIPQLKQGGRIERAPRKPIFRPGKVYINKTEALRCVIRNVSDTGVYIHLQGAHPLPPVVVLRFDQSGAVKKARVAWQHGAEVGLAFVNQGAHDAEPAPAVAH